MSTADGAPWAAGVDEVLGALGGSRGGLDAREAERRRAQHGPNQLPEKPRRSPWALAFAQLRGFLNVILIAAAILAGTIGDAHDAVMIGFVVIFNAVLGFFQEHRAERTLAALKAMVPAQARVLRDGNAQPLPAAALVPGDVVLLEGGDRVPADGRLVETHALEIDESALTGESVPVSKRAQAVVPAAAALADRVNTAFMNTVATRGRGVLLVTATGAKTEMGRVAAMLEETKQPATPLQRQLDQLGKRLATIAVVVVVVISTFELLRGDSWLDTAFEAIALFVAAIPEGLPAVVTVTLALGLHRMARNRAIVKRLAAVETLGCTTVICTDKTGTLTMNQMTARDVWYAGRRFAIPDQGAAAPELQPLAVAVALCNDSRLHEGKVVGDPTEGALLVLARKVGVDGDAVRFAQPRLAEVPFESERKFMATVHAEGDGLRMFVKGAPDVVVGRCALDERQRAALARENEALASRGLRVLAVASRALPAGALVPGGDALPHVAELTLLGLVGLVDPPRTEAGLAIQQCQRAGIVVKMITGDHRATAGAIARELGLGGDVIDGAQLDGLDDAALAARVESIGVFARVAPEHKLRIVRALAARGHVVAMTGDGVNDAPALKSADIGVAMGSGTEVAKQAATMVLTDDNFATLVGAVREGRTIYDNILKFVRFQLSTNMGAILTIFFAPLLGLPSPLKPIHILFVAMFTDGPPAITLGLDPAGRAIMLEPPRDPRARILTGSRLGVLIFYGAVMAAGTLGLLAWLGRGGQGADHAATLAFTTFVLFQLFNLLNVRSEGRTAFARHTFTNWRLWMAAALVAGLQVAVVTWAPLRRVFDTVPLSPREWGLAAAFASSLVVLDELRKLLARALAWSAPRRRRGRRRALGRPVDDGRRQREPNVEA